MVSEIPENGIIKYHGRNSWKEVSSERKSANLICRLTQLSVVGTNTIRVLASSSEHSHSNNVPAAAHLSVKYCAGRLVMFPQSTLGLFSFSLGLLNVSCHHSNRACQHSLTIVLLLSHFLIPEIALHSLWEVISQRLAWHCEDARIKVGGHGAFTITSLM